MSRDLTPRQRYRGGTLLAASVLHFLAPFVHAPFVLTALPVRALHVLRSVDHVVLFALSSHIFLELVLLFKLPTDR